MALLTFALRAQRRPLVVGVESLVGLEGQMRSPGQVQVAGELWSAAAGRRRRHTLEPGQPVVVTAVRG